MQLVHEELICIHIKLIQKALANPSISYNPHMKNASAK